MSTDLALITEMFKTNAGLFDKAVKDVPAEQWLTRPGDDSNHLLWIAGHAVVTRALVLKLLGEEWSAPWEKLFARGAKLAAAEEYPPIAEVCGAWKDLATRVPAALAGVSSETLERPVPPGRPTLNGKVGGSIGFLCLHETYHMGQLNYLRKWLGHGQALG